MDEKVLIINFDGNAKDAARTARELGCYSVIKGGNVSAYEIEEINPIGIVVSGKPDNKNAGHRIVSRLLDKARPKLPVLTGGINAAKLKTFLQYDCKANFTYSPKAYLDAQIEEVKRLAGDNKVLLALSGGVDSSVCAALFSRALPGQAVCVFVDHGLMRLNEGYEVAKAFKRMKVELIMVDASDRFFAKLKGVTDPEKKREIIGAEFVAVFREESAKLGHIPFLAQGTIVTDLLESGKNSGFVKSHHNVGGLPSDIGFEGIIEPLSGLFKDEVRKVGLLLGLPKHFVYRQPFPGPGLGVRIIGSVTKEKAALLQKADYVFRREVLKLRKAYRPDQYFCVHTGLSSVGVVGGKRAEGAVIAIRAVSTADFISANIAHIPQRILIRIADTMLEEVPGISRVVYDITKKPPGTIEWE